MPEVLSDSCCARRSRERNIGNNLPATEPATPAGRSQPPGRSKWTHPAPSNPISLPPPYPSHARQQVDPPRALPHPIRLPPPYPSHAREQVDPPFVTHQPTASHLRTRATRVSRWTHPALSTAPSASRLRTRATRVSKWTHVARSHSHTRAFWVPRPERHPAQHEWGCGTPTARGGRQVGPLADARGSGGGAGHRWICGEREVGRQKAVGLVGNEGCVHLLTRVARVGRGGEPVGLCGTTGGSTC